MLIIEKLSFRFPNRVILDQASLEIRPATITCLLGGNGAGKTTLFNLITGFLRPDAGSISWDHTAIVGIPPYHISRLGVTRTFQDLRLIGRLTVRENILLALPRQPGERVVRALFPSCFHKTVNTDACLKADQLSADFYLTEVADEPASEISYGQQKLLTLACCVATEAKLLLLDEPVAGIGPEFRERVAEHLVTLRTQGVTVLLIEHQPDFLQSVGEQFFFLQAGQLHFFETLSELTAARVAHEAFN